MERMHELIDLLNEYARHYYVLDNPIVSDKEYDELFDELVRLEQESGVVLSNSPTRRVGGEPIKAFGEHRHIQRLYSLDKVKSVEELRAWYNKVLLALNFKPKMSVETKLDGLTLCFTYENGSLKTCATRGNGVVGEDVTAQAITIKSVPLSIDFKGKIEVQGEGIMRLSALEKYNATAAEPLKNARNGVAGAIRNLDPKVTASRNLDVLFYSVNYIEGVELTSQQQIFEFLNSNGFACANYALFSEIDQVCDYIEGFDKQGLDYLIDGLVIKLDGAMERDILGFTDRFPRWAVAYKFEAEEVTTRILDVVWQVGRTGKLTPLALLEPVELGGATIKRATLNNYGDIERKKVMIGSRVFVRRSNDVIPEILGAVEEKGSDHIKVQPPLACPACSHQTVQEGAHIFCVNSQCPPQRTAKLNHFCACMDIDGISEKTAELLVHTVGVNSPTELYRLTEQDLSSLDGFKQKKISNLLAAINKSKSASLESLIFALGIPNVGKKTAQDLARVFTRLGNLAKATYEQLIQIPEVGEAVAFGIVEYFAQNTSIVSQFEEIGISPSYKVLSTRALAGKKVVLTGSMEGLTRGQATKLIEDAGGFVSSAVTKDTSFVVAGSDAGSKLQKAQKLGITVIDKEQLLGLIQG